MLDISLRCCLDGGFQNGTLLRKTNSKTNITRNYVPFKMVQRNVRISLTKSLSVKTISTYPNDRIRVYLSEQKKNYDLHAARMFYM